MKVVTMIYVVPVEQTTTVIVEFSLPPSQREIRLLPSARLHPLVLRVGPRVYDDAEARTIVIPDELPPLREREGDVFVLVLAGGTVGFGLSAILGTPSVDSPRRTGKGRRRKSRAEFDSQAAVVFAVVAVVAALVL